MTHHTKNAQWERYLLDLAFEAQPNGADCSQFQTALRAEGEELEQALANCEAITAEHSRSFYLASGLLPFEKRRAMRALYAFCRTADNLVDGNADQPAAQLQTMRQGLRGQADRTDPILTAWAVIQARYVIPICYAEQLLNGVEHDLERYRYRTFDDLTVYCYRVASTVGLMSMHITGYVNDAAVPYAIKLGVALQLTNILRDVGEDWQAGRVYLPLDELAAFGLRETDIAAGSVDDRWRGLLRFQINRARRLYREALPGIALLHPDGRLAVTAAAFLYRGILDDIEVHDFDVFSRRAFVNRWRKVLLLLEAFAAVRRINGAANSAKLHDAYGEPS